MEIELPWQGQENLQQRADGNQKQHNRRGGGGGGGEEEDLGDGNSCDGGCDDGDDDDDVALGLGAAAKPTPVAPPPPKGRVAPASAAPRRHHPVHSRGRPQSAKLGAPVKATPRAPAASQGRGRRASGEDAGVGRSGSDSEDSLDSSSVGEAAMTGEVGNRRHSYTSLSASTATASDSDDALSADEDFKVTARSLLFSKDLSSDCVDSSAPPSLPLQAPQAPSSPVGDPVATEKELEDEEVELPSARRSFLSSVGAGKYTNSIRKVTETTSSRVKPALQAAMFQELIRQDDVSAPLSPSPALVHVCASPPSQFSSLGPVDPNRLIASRSSSASSSAAGTA